MEIFIGRQPIFNIHEQIVAYELLYRSKNSTSFPMVDSDAATVEVLMNSFLSFGIEEVTKGRPCFVNFTENLLMKSGLTDYLDPSLVVIEILEDVPITPDLVKRVIELKAMGYRVALDDFILDATVAHYDELFRYIDFIKVDFLLSPEEERREVEEKVRTQFPFIKLLAEKVESREQYEQAKEAGYILFQGYFFEKPQTLAATDIPANTLQYFQIVSLLKDDEPDINLIAQTIEHDVSLSYKLLQVINFALKRNRSKISSIKQAILLLGLSELRKWIYFVAMSESSKNQEGEVYNEILRTCLFRAKACELLAKKKFKQNAAEYFLIGMFSLMDSILQRPIDVIVQQLPLSELITQTLAGQETEMTPYLTISKALGKLEFDTIQELATTIEIDIETLEQIYIEASEWAEEASVQ